MGIQDILQFVKLTHEFQKVERMVYINGEDRRENDVEHSYQLAMVAWYIIDSKKLSLDQNLIIKDPRPKGTRY